MLGSTYMYSIFENLLVRRADVATHGIQSRLATPFLAPSHRADFCRFTVHTVATASVVIAFKIVYQVIPMSDLVNCDRASASRSGS